MKRHDSMRGWFAYELFKEMGENKNVWLVVADLGYKMWDDHFIQYPDRCINTGAAETSMMTIACGLALSGKIPFCYSITPFLLYRPFEVWMRYINHEQLNVKGIGSGRDRDYKIDGISHDASDARKVLDLFPNINTLWPDTKEEIPDMVRLMVYSISPMFISLRR